MKELITEETGDEEKYKEDTELEIVHHEVHRYRQNEHSSIRHGISAKVEGECDEKIVCAGRGSQK